MDNNDAARVVRSITIRCGADEAYNYWHELQNLPRFMTYVESVEARPGGRSHWKVRGPMGMDVEWDAEIILDKPNRVIVWRSDEDTRFENAGSVQFTPVPDGRGTVVRVEMRYDPRGGTFTNALSKLFGVDVGQKISHDLRNFKQLMELGEVTQSDASIHREKHPAQPDVTRRVA
jgi:uncharacterized membrane protein